MGRKRTGSVYEKDGALWYSFLLRSKKRYAKKVPPHPSGRAATEPEARAYLEVAIRKYELGLWDPEAPTQKAEAPAPPPTPTLFEYATQWVATLHEAAKINEGIFVRRQLKDTDFGGMKITEIQPAHIAAWVRGLASRPSSQGGTLAPLTIRAYVKYVKRIFATAVFERVIPATPCVLPKGIVPAARDKVVGARRSWRQTRQEIVALISDVRVPEERRVLWALLFFSGDRAGEGFAVRWLDIEQREPLNCLHVARSWSRAQKIFKDPKTGVAREVPIHPTLAAILAEWKLSGWERVYGRKPKSEDLICPASTFNPRNTGRTRMQMHHDLHVLGYERRRLHGLRHAFVSIAIDDGADRDVISKITHKKPNRGAFDGYVAESWTKLCAEVSKIKVQRAPDVLPLWSVASSGGGSAEGNATDNATPQPTTNGNTMQEGSPAKRLSVPRIERDFRGALFSQDKHAKASGDEVSEPEHLDTSDTDSATDSATVGALSGELWAQDWFERSLLAEAGEAGGGEP